MLPNGQMIFMELVVDNPSDGPGTLDRRCSKAFHASNHTPAIRWVRNNSQGTNQRNWLLRQENDVQLNLWEYNGTTWSVPVAFHKDYLDGVNHDLAFITQGL